MRTFATTLLCLLSVQVGCSQDRTWTAVHHMIDTNFPTVASITTDSLAERLADSTATRPLLLDARSPEEYAVSHLPGARRVAPDARTFPVLDTLSRDVPIVVYCSVGYRSARVTKRLQERGFTEVANLRGSIFRWANDGRPVVRDGTPVRAVHPYNQTWGTLLDADLHAYAPTEDATTAPNE
jgi:rhodanese-related sulfurtransferase